jgi:hypothetical protein
LLDEEVALSACLYVTLSGSQHQPHICLGFVRRYPLSASCQDLPQAMLCRGKPLVCRKLPPSYCFSIVLRHSGTLPVIVTESILCKRIRLHGRPAVPPDRFLFIFGYTAAMFVQETEAELGFGIPLFSAGA